MSSSYSPWIYRKFLYHIPFLWKKCPEGNYHIFWDRLCFCRLNGYCGDWHGGIYDFKTGKEYQPCPYCERDNPRAVRALKHQYKRDLIADALRRGRK